MDHFLTVMGMTVSGVAESEDGTVDDGRNGDSSDSRKTTTQTSINPSVYIDVSHEDEKHSHETPLLRRALCHPYDKQASKCIVCDVESNGYIQMIAIVLIRPN